VSWYQVYVTLTTLAQEAWGDEMIMIFLMMLTTPLMATMFSIVIIDDHPHHIYRTHDEDDVTQVYVTLTTLGQEEWRDEMITTPLTTMMCTIIVIDGHVHYVHHISDNHITDRQVYVTLTTLGQEDWCAAPYSDAFANKFVVPSFAFRNETYRTYNIISKVGRDDQHEEGTERKRTKRGRRRIMTMISTICRPGRYCSIPPEGGDW
jgi:hypothetical protein